MGICFTVESSTKGQTLLDVLYSYVEKNISSKVSKRAIKREIDQKGCFINGKIERFASKKVYFGYKIQMHLDLSEKKQKITWEKERILYEDDEFLLYNKPAGISVDNQGLSSLAPFDAELVHRLDKETTGVLLLAKNAEISKKLQTLFRGRKVIKEYIALVDGSSETIPTVVDRRLETYKPHKGKVLTRLSKTGEGKEAITYFKILSRGKKSMLVFCKPLTGRTHQIRLHCIDIGHPILGDYNYCRDYVSKCYPQRVMLHALKITFLHPITKEELVVAAPVPQDFLQVQKKLDLCVP